MHVDQAPHEGQSDSQSSLGPVERAIDLCEHLEDPGQHVRRDADAVVAHPHDHRVSLPLGREPDLPAALGVLGRIIEQVQKDLGQPNEVGIERHRLVRQVDDQLVAVLVDHGPACFDGALEHLGQIDALFSQLDFSAADPRQVEQVVDQVDHLLHLAVDDRFARLEGRRIVAGNPHDLQGIADGGEGIPQLVGQRRQELVLVAVHRAKFLVEPRIVEGDGRHVGQLHEDRLVVGAEIARRFVGDHELGERFSAAADERNGKGVLRNAAPLAVKQDVGALRPDNVARLVLDHAEHALFAGGRVDREGRRRHVPQQLGCAVFRSRATGRSPPAPVFAA